MQRYFIKIRAAVHYFVQQPLSFLQRVQELSLPAFLSGGNVLKTVMAQLMPGLGVHEQHPVLIDWHRFIGASANFSRKHRKRRFWPQLAGKPILLAETENSANGIRWLILAIGSK